MDDLSLQLAIALQLRDIESALSSRKGKGRAGDALTTSDVVAFNDYREHLQREAQILLDERFAQSVDKAVRADADELREITRAELEAENDRLFAMGLSEEPVSTAAVRKSQWRNMAIGSGVEVTDDAIEVWEQKCLEWDHIEAQNPGGPSTSTTLAIRNKNTEATPSSLVVRKKYIGGSSKALVVRKTMIDCAICMETFPQDETISTTCKHSYCHDCLRQVFTNACKDEQLFPPRCCKQEIPVDLAMRLLSNAEAEEFLDKSEEFTTDNRTYCHRPTCSRFISPTMISCDVGMCPHCFSLTCVLCKKEEHEGDCPDDPSMALTLATAAENGWARCKRCHALVELAYGCQHMTCRCKAEWCYRCGVEWKNCECNDWDNTQLNRRAEDLAIREAGPRANAVVIAGLAMQIRENLVVNHECEHVSEKQDLKR